MKTFNAWVLSCTLMGLTGAAVASDNSADLAACKAEVETALGGEGRTKLVGIKRRRGPDQLRLVVIPGEGERFIVHCLVDERGPRFLDRDGVALQLGEFHGKNPVSMQP
ncbi:MAG TPA: hypothetical protein DD808_01315 [Halieaceae bacterium]|jgi:hypothetical protein|uniref:hypothetical protein n=1 Tax=Haliea TaxID=475794 RepID=UPI000C558124|nr:hypothetical protein [Haliea sp.]HAN67794.1 hypothetical protein [Halieaceae bacterium]MAD65169.1 hypothetical protein [Haliea sp.]MAY92930.1 hypothetical protein [Haliea sp.]MBK40417.1 hypothetical protein [Haliea sp.]MBP68868.1 hypothetical protein [Haliea sp.]|tara:strand:+ start:11423 stop:11749 length:327 start_codon:yes stop_codon:yes gene_type:complete